MSQLPEKAEVLIESRERDLGGFSVRRMLPFSKKRQVGPFVFFDQMGPADITIDNGMSVRPHPHIGLATVTYLFEGCIMHRDSLGTRQPIFPGEVNWMTAGRGVSHSERTPKEPELFHNRLNGIQLWVALPKEHEEIEPAFVNFKAEALPKFEVNGVKTTLILGEAFGYKSPVPVYSPILYFDAAMQAGQELPLQFGEKDEFAVYIADGEIQVEGMSLSTYQMLVFRPGAAVTLKASSDTRLVVIGGEYLGEERFIWWNFVSSSKARIEKAKYDWINNNFGQVPEETEFIPLPEDGYPVLYP